MPKVIPQNGSAGDIALRLKDFGQVNKRIVLAKQRLKGRFLLLGTSLKP